MLTKTKMAIAAALVLGSASATLAQEIVPEVDGDGNRTGVYDVLPQAHNSRAGSSIERSFAGPRQQAREPVYNYGANGPAWERNFEQWLNQD
jgi:hypothetical protein